MTTNINYGASKEIIQRARELRRRMTSAERKLWRHICNKQLGVKFRKQHPLYKYVVDFYCHELKLVIEVDGSIHDDPDNIIDDRFREEHLLGFGLYILRVKNDQIFNSIDNVCADIRHTISLLTINQSLEEKKNLL